METTIRYLEPKHVTSVVTLWLLAFQEMQEMQRPAMQLRNNAPAILRAWVRERIRERRSLAFVAEIDGNFAGFALGRVSDWDSEPPILEPRRIGVIDAVYVSEPYRSHGVGRKLVAHAIEKAEARGVRVMETTFELENQPASRMWKKMGFVPWIARAYRLSEFAESLEKSET